MNFCKICLVGHVWREANCFAHNLIKLTGEEDNDALWWMELPHPFAILTLLNLNEVLGNE